MQYLASAALILCSHSIISGPLCNWNNPKLINEAEAVSERNISAENLKTEENNDLKRNEEKRENGYLTQSAIAYEEKETRRRREENRLKTKKQWLEEIRNKSAHVMRKKMKWRKQYMWRERNLYNNCISSAMAMKAAAKKQREKLGREMAWSIWRENMRNMKKKKISTKYEISVNNSEMKWMNEMTVWQRKYVGENNHSLWKWRRRSNNEIRRRNSAISMKYQMK